MSGDLAPRLTSEVIGGIAGQIQEKLRISGLISKRLTKSIAQIFYKKSQEQKEMEIQKANLVLSDQLETLVTEIRTFLSGLSVPRANLTAKGNSDILMRKLNRVSRYSTIHRRAKELIMVIDELLAMDIIMNSDIPSFLEKTRPSSELASSIINGLEVSLRNMLREEGRKRLGDNYIDIIPSNVQTSARRKLVNEVNESIPSNEDLFSYLEFSDYTKIILDENNWYCSFSNVFPSKEWIKIKLNEIKPIRNSVFHSRRITKDQLERLRLNSADIINKVEGRTRKS
jgi:hypothetical protein